MTENILVTGGSGFIGSHLHNYLNHAQIVNLDLETPDFICHSRYIKGDIRDVDTVAEAVKGCKMIWSMAAAHKDFGVSHNEYFDINEKGMQVLTQAASQEGIKKFIFISSVAVYGNALEPPTETSIPNPINDYGASKLAAERVLEAWAAEDLTRQVLIIRPAVVYGERNFANVYHLMAHINRGRFFNVGKGLNIKSIVYVKNLLEAILFLMERMTAGVNVYNYVDEPQLTSRQIGETIAAALNKSKPFTLPYSLVYLLALPFDLLIKIIGKDFPISTKRVKKFITPTHFKANKIRELGFKIWLNGLKPISHKNINYFNLYS